MHYNQLMMIYRFISIFLIFIWFQEASAEINLKLLTFNTMCEFCHKKEEDKFENRKEKIKQIIKKSEADIISLQEIIRKSQVEYFLNKDKYHVYFYENSIMSYPDAVIAINKKKFLILDKGHYWLGDDTTSFNLGWKTALPRILLWVKAQHIDTKRTFTFLASHFDNRIENLDGSAKLVKNIAQKSKDIIFLADTNSTYEMNSYKVLTENLKDLAIDFEGDRKYCYLKKGKKFPSCRVDHILSNIQNIKSNKYQVILDKVDKRFPSDHRPIYLEVSL